MARPKSEATRIKDLETRIKYLELEKQKAEEEAHHVRQRAIKMSDLFFDMQVILDDLRSSEGVFEDGAAHPYVHALLLMAEKGTDI